MIRGRTKMILVATLMTASLVVLFVPKTKAYGTSIGTAETISMGNTNEIFYSGDNSAYFKISCSSRDMLNITLKYQSGNDLCLLLYDPSGTGVDSSSTGNPEGEAISYICTSDGDHCILVFRTSSTWDTYINMTVTKTAIPFPAPRVPGYNLMILSGITFASIIVLLMKLQRNRRF